MFIIMSISPVLFQLKIASCFKFQVQTNSMCVDLPLHRGTAEDEFLIQKTKRRC